MAGIEIAVIAIIIVFAALALPILFNENPAAFLENGLCTILTPGSGTNTTCNSIKGNVTFIGNFPIFITANHTSNEITWSFGQMGNTTHVNIGGGAEVFKNDTSGLTALRTLISTSPAITITQNDETLEFQFGQGGGGPLQNINNQEQNLFNSTQEGNTVTFVGQGITITNTSSIVFALNASLSDLNDVNVTNPDERHILIFNETSGNFTNKRIDGFISLIDQYFNAEEATVDDLTGVDCVNDVTISYFNGTEENEYRRQAVEFCSSGESDDNITWLYVVPKDYTKEDFKFRLFWSDDDPGASSFTQRTRECDDHPEENCDEGDDRSGDSEENISDGHTHAGSFDLELHDQPSQISGYVAMQWIGVPIPNGATITNANIQFHVDEVLDNSPLTVRFRGEDIDNPAPLSPFPNICGEFCFDFDISNRVETTAFVDWAIPPWTSVSDEGPAQLSADLSVIIQEIVDRPGWSPGNDMTIMIKSWPIAGGQRTAESAEGESFSAPQITIDWLTGGEGVGQPVCWEFSLLTLADTDLLDGAIFTARDTQCTNRSGTDKLSITEFTVLEVNHQFASEDLVFLRMNRPNDFVPNDFEFDVYVLGGELQWIN